MKKDVFNLFLLLCMTAALVACSNEGPSDIDFNKLTRFDMKDESKEWMITNEDQLLELRTILNGVEWEENVKSEMTRKEDANARFFITYDKNEPERLFDYSIWQNEEVIIMVDKESHIYGQLDKNQGTILKKILFAH
ncbi:hypothetical protein [Cytobacillus purgationiresistens]|uniref:Lipoprotein n=1 Tax=Cytobacillus purgationiresistens TaxID=863449 RepID=A0ABU0AFG2_9BACI|nr:hypothetical protein [Cytobacillus purgationiresistens]MDQ0269996.1 hypothetical protein [Cytobacillus purgationiresistens]